jgi:DNA-binding transcriptional MerR regulator
MLNRRLFGASAGVVLVGLALIGNAAPRAEAQGWKAERLLSAVYELREAESEISAAKHDFGGHRKYAVQAIQAAVEQCEKLLKEAGVPLKYVKRKLEDYPKGHGNYPHLREAMVECEAARKEVEQTKGAWVHKEQALRDLNTATEQLRIAEKYAK